MLGCCISETTIGIVIGSAFTLLGVIVNGLITFFLNRSTHNKEVEERKRREAKELDDEKRVKKERAYREFASFYAFMNLLAGIACATKGNQESASIFGNIYQEKIKDNFSKAAEVMSDIMFYGSSAISNMCQDYQGFWNLETLKGFPVEDFAQLDQKLMIVMDAMKKELGLDSL
jgi:hypothetical protein